MDATVILRQECVNHVGRWGEFWPVCGTEGERGGRDCPESLNTITLRQFHKFVTDFEQLHTVAKLQISTNGGRL